MTSSYNPVKEVSSLSIINQTTNLRSKGNDNIVCQGPVRVRDWLIERIEGKLSRGRLCVPICPLLLHLLIFFFFFFFFEPRKELFTFVYLRCVVVCFHFMWRVQQVESLSQRNSVFSLHHRHKVTTSTFVDSLLFSKNSGARNVLPFYRKTTLTF